MDIWLGVNIEDSWPKKLETYLKKSGTTNIEVINCGQPGKSTLGYKKNIAKVVPLLKPDLVLVGVLQLEDLAQIYESNFDSLQWDKGSLFFKVRSSSAPKMYLKESFKNIINLFKKPNYESILVNSTWKAQNERIINKFSHSERILFSTLSDTVRTMFKSGNLDPSILRPFAYYAFRDLIFNDPYHPATIFAIAEMKNDFAVMNRICLMNHAKLIFLNLPRADFTGHHLVELAPGTDLRRTYLYNNNKIDSIYQAIANQTNIPYVDMTNRFKNLADKSAYFFGFDDHPTVKGQEQIAFAVGEFLIANGIINY